MPLRGEHAGNFAERVAAMQRRAHCGVFGVWSGHNGLVRRFNTEGPIRAEDHYAIDPLARLDLGELRDLVAAKRYFILHAPRQTGKTSVLLAFQNLLNGAAGGGCRCLYINVEVGQAAREDTGQAMLAILGEIVSRARLLGDDFPATVWREVLADFGPHGALKELLTRWSLHSPEPLVLLIDEIDALLGDTLLSVLRQLRAGYDQRPRGFPQSIVLCGVRDIRDYRIDAASAKEPVAGGSAFNISAKSLRLGDFDETEVRTLLGQHTRDTGQPFESGALDAVWRETRGQPWLVNALAAAVCFDRRSGRDRSRPIDEAAILSAKEDLVQSRRTHLDQLADKLREPRVQRVVEPLLAGSAEASYGARDLEYVRDLGLIAADSPVRMANPIYAEVAPRELSSVLQDSLVQETQWYVDADGGLDVGKLLAAFQEFFREHSEHWADRFTYKEAGPQLILQGFLQRIVNGGGRIEREYGIGRGRTDLLIVWPQGRADGPPGAVDRHVVECKTRRGDLETTITGGVEQTAAYMDGCDAKTGHLVLFDRGDRPWEEKIFHRVQATGTREIVVWGM